MEYGGGRRGILYTFRYTLTTRMTPALRWAAMTAILMFHNCQGQSHKTVSTDHSCWREKRAEADSNRGPSAYQPNALPLGQSGWQLWLLPHNYFKGSRFDWDFCPLGLENAVTFTQCIPYKQVLKYQQYITTALCTLDKNKCFKRSSKLWVAKAHKKTFFFIAVCCCRFDQITQERS